MKPVLPIAVSVNLTPFAWNTNKRILSEALAAAEVFASNPANWSAARVVNGWETCVTASGNETPQILVVFPELCLAGPGYADWLGSDEVLARSRELLEELLPLTQGMTVFFGLPVRAGGQVHKEMVVAENGRLKESVSDGMTIIELDRLEQVVDRTGEVIICSGSVPFELGGMARLRERLQEESRRRNALIIFANYLGNESGTMLYDGGSLITTPKETAQGRRFSYEDFTLTTLADTLETLPDWERSANLAYEEFARAVPLGLFDYLRKCKGQGYTLSLSGGADSAACAVLCRLMVEFGRSYPGFRQKLTAMKPFADCACSGDLSPEALMPRLLWTVYQGTRNSSEVTRIAAREVAKAVASTHYEFDVDPLVEAYKGMVSTQIGRPLTWQEDDLALQNIQARTRAPGVWLLANATKSVLLTTCNRSEEAAGYATMDGDTSGGLAPLGGIDKAFLRRWLLWMEKEGPCDGPAFAALSYINDQQPTAELRPGAAHQTDEADLMPYVILNLFEEAVVAKKLVRNPAIDWVQERQSDVDASYPREQLASWYDRFWRMWRASQWKRERSAPSFHVDTRDLSPSACQFPILSGD
ncbi:MAG: hypothetical protein Q4G68_13105 [Planctomycetia bacterium]|nr:hypothetical protein [Planctomycetia bacterium]